MSVHVNFTLKVKIRNKKLYIYNLKVNLKGNASKKDYEQAKTSEILKTKYKTF